MKNAYLLYDFFFLYRLFALQNNVSVMWCIFDKQLLTGDL